MKSNKIALSNSLSCAMEALQEVERASERARLNREQTNTLRLLTEEMISMTTDILSTCQGMLWLEWEGESWELHLTATAPIDPEARAALIAASREKINSPVKGLKSKISALFAELLSAENASVPSVVMSGPEASAIWSLAEEYKQSGPDRLAELEGVERSILLGFADDVVVAVKNNWVELTVKKRFASRAALPKFTGLSHICIFVDDMEAAVAYYRRLLGAVPDHYLSHWKNRGFFKAAGFLDQAGQGDVSIAFINVPGTRLTLELMQYHYPEGRKEPVFFAANDVSGARHVALKVTNIEEAFLHVKSMPDTRLINQSEAYRVFQISETQPSEVRFFDQDLRESDERNVETAKILSQVRYFYFIDRYGLQWEFEQGHSDIGD